MRSCVLFLVSSHYLSMMTGSEGVSFRLPQLFFSQQRLRKRKKEKVRTGEKKLNICLAHPHARAGTILPHSWPKREQTKEAWEGWRRRDKRILKKEEKVQQHTLQNSERAFKSEKPAGQSVTLIPKSNAAPMQPHSCVCTHTQSHNILPFVSCPVQGACWPAIHFPLLPKVPFTA